MVTENQQKPFHTFVLMQQKGFREERERETEGEMEGD